MPTRLILFLLALTLASCCSPESVNRYTAPLQNVPAKGPGGRIRRADIFQAIGLPEPGPMATHLNGAPREVIQLNPCVTMELWHNYRRSGVPDPSSMNPLAPDSPPKNPFYFYDQVESIQLYKNNGTPIMRRDTAPFRARKKS